MQHRLHRSLTRNFFSFISSKTQITLLSILMLSVSGPAFAELVINEIMQNPSEVGDDSGEWYEIYNPDGAAVDIDGCANQ